MNRLQDRSLNMDTGLCTSLVLILQFLKVHPLTVAVSPSIILNGLTESIDVSCTYRTGEDPTLTSLTSLILVYSNNSTHERDIASVNSFTGIKLSDNVTANGAEDNSGTSYLNVTWHNPKLDQVGGYRCEADGLDQIGHPLKLTSSMVNVSGVGIEADLLIKEIVRLRTYTDNLNTEIIALKDQVSNFINKWTQRSDASQKTLFETSAVYKGSQYFLYNEDLNFGSLQAQASCQSYGGTLVEIGSDDEFNFVQNFIETSSDAALVLIGGNQVNTIGNWVYPETNHNMTYFRWVVQYPIPTLGANCLFLWGSFGWNMTNLNCLNSFYMRYMCEVIV